MGRSRPRRQELRHQPGTVWSVWPRPLDRRETRLLDLFSTREMKGPGIDSRLECLHLQIEDLLSSWRCSSSSTELSGGNDPLRHQRERPPLFVGQGFSGMMTHFELRNPRCHQHPCSGGHQHVAAKWDVVVGPLAVQTARLGQTGEGLRVICEGEVPC